MNKRLYFEAGELLFEKRGHKWVLTMFAFEVYDDIDIQKTSSDVPTNTATEGSTTW